MTLSDQIRERMATATPDAREFGEWVLAQLFEAAEQIGLKLGIRCFFLPHSFCLYSSGGWGLKT